MRSVWMKILFWTKTPASAATSGDAGPEPLSDGAALFTNPGR